MVATSMGVRFWTWMAILVLAVSSDTALSDPISVVLVAEDDDTIAKTAIRFGIERDQGAAEPKFKVDVVGFDATVNTEADICQKIFVEGRTPHLVIDATKEYNGTRPTFAKRSQMLKSLLRKMGAPTVSLTATLYAYPGPPLTDAEKEYILSFIPPDLLLSNVAKSVADVIGTQKIGIVYDQTFPFTNKVGLLFDNIPSAIAMIPLSSEINETVRKVEVSDLGNIFVFASETNLNALLQLISKNDMLKHYAWFTISKDSTDLKTTVVNKFSVLHFKPKVLHSDMEKALESYASDAKVDSGFYHDLAAIFREYLLESVGKEGSWPATLTYPECADEMVLTEEMVAERSAIKMRSAIEARESSKGLKGTFGDFVLKSTHPRRTYGFQNIKMEVEKVTLTTKEPVMKSELFWQFQADKKLSALFSGPTDVVNNHKGPLIVQITAIHDPPFMYKTTVDGKVKWIGYCVDLIEMLKKEANLTFEYRITENKDNIQGDMRERRNRNITWNGMIGDIVEGRADLALGPIFVMPDRELFVDFTMPFYDLMGVSILMKWFYAERSALAFIYVLEDNVWYCFLATYFITSLTIFLFERLQPYDPNEKNPEKSQDVVETPRDFSFKESLWFCITSLTPQGGGDVPRNVSGRLVAGTWWLFGFIMVASYMANFSAFLTVARLDRTIETFEQLRRQYKVKYSSVEGSLAYNYYNRMFHIEAKFFEIWKNISLDDVLNATEKAELAVWDYPVSDKYTKIWWTMKETSFYSSFEEAVRKIRGSNDDEGYAVIAEAYKVQYATLRYCDLREIGQAMSRRPIAIALRKGSALKEPLSNAILKLTSEGVLENLKYKWWNENPYGKKCYHYVKRNDGTELGDLAGLFYLLAGGVAFAIVTLLVEFIYFKYMTANERVIKVKSSF